MSNRLYADASEYIRLLKAYTFWSNIGHCQKHYTHDSTFFIVKDGEKFQTIKFYIESEDYRISGLCETLAEAYNEAYHTL